MIKRYRLPYTFIRAGLAAVAIAACISTPRLLSAQTMPSSPQPPCVHQPSPGAKIGPTHVFAPINPNHATRTLENPLAKGAKTGLVMLTLGDSAVWGNGLRYSSKYAQLVAQYVANGTGRIVSLVAYAHSGANLANEADSCYAPTMPGDGGPPGDLNAGLPSVTQQETSAAASYQNAELVLIDGCINDVGAQRIALPFPFSRATPDEIRQLAHHWCSDCMLSLLRSTVNDFPHATIIVSNYWLIISDKSSPIGLALSKNQVNFTPQERAEYRDVRDLLKAELKAEKEAGEHSTDVTALSDPKRVLRKWSDNSKAFLDTSETCFDWAVATVDGKTVAPNAADSCPATNGVDPQAVTAGLRTFLAKVSRDPKYSYGAGRSKRLWSVPDPIFRPDQLYAKRAKLCNTHYDNDQVAEQFICYVNPTAHPNVSGATAFNASITYILARAWGK